MMGSFTAHIEEGRVPFSYSGLDKPCETWYKTYGDTKASSTGRPLILLHGGPGFCHNYMLPLQRLASTFGIALVFYDQLGCGNSTRLPERRLDFDLWQTELFEAELENLCAHLSITEFDLLGHSWGGMLAAHFSIKRPPGLKHLIISNSPASMRLWVESCNGLRAELPAEINETIDRCEKAEDFENSQYKNAVVEFYQRHLCRIRGEGGDPFPKPMMDSMAIVDEDNTVYFTMNGPSEFTVIGNLKDWSVVGKLGNVNVPTLILNGEFDEAQPICVEPYAKEIRGSIWKTIAGASHSSFIEKTEEYCEIVVNFLQNANTKR